MEKVLGNIAASVTDIESAPRLLAGTGSDQVHLLVVCTAERGCAVRSIRRSCGSRGKKRRSGQDRASRSKIFCVGRKGNEQLRRTLGKQIIEVVDLRGVRNLAFENAQAVAAKIVARFEGGEFDVARCSSRASSR